LVEEGLQVASEHRCLLRTCYKEVWIKEDEVSNWEVRGIPQQPCCIWSVKVHHPGVHWCYIWNGTLQPHCQRLQSSGYQCLCN
jgi:hypothetical protein